MSRTAHAQADGDPGLVSVEERLTALIEHELGIVGGVTRGMTFDHDLRMDSVDRLSLTLAVEEDFGLELPDTSSAGMRTVDDLVVWIEQHEAAQAISS